MKVIIKKLLFLALMATLSLGSGPIAQNEILKMIEALSRPSIVQVQEHDEEEKESEEIKKYPNYSQNIQ